MPVYLAFSREAADSVRNAGEVTWGLYAPAWPAHYHKKWIPLAPSVEQAVRRFREATGGEPAWALKVGVPDSLWRDATIVWNPGHRRSGADYTDTEGHMLYGRVTRDRADPVFVFRDLGHDWIQA